MTVKPILNFGIDVAEVPGVGDWMVQNHLKFYFSNSNFKTSNSNFPPFLCFKDKVLCDGLEKCLVEPNMLVVDLDKLFKHWFPSPSANEPMGSRAETKVSDFFHVEEMEALATVKIEVLEAENLRPSDLNGDTQPILFSYLDWLLFM